MKTMFCTEVSRPKPRSLLVLSIIAMSCCALPSAGGQALNSWISPVSGDWTNAQNWSLGQLPRADHIIAVTNTGYKAVGISAATVTAHPESLTISNLWVSAPTNSLSMLLLNYAGLGVPLQVGNECVIGTNGIVANFYSSLQVKGAGGGTLTLNSGQLIQEGGLSVIDPAVSLNNGSLFLTNAAVTMGPLTMKSEWPGLAQVYQDGGSVLCASIHGGSYHLIGGVLYSVGGTFLKWGDSFDHRGGTNYGDVEVRGEYSLYSGLLRGNKLLVNNRDAFRHAGGVVTMQTVELHGFPSDYGYRLPVYSLTNGSLHCGHLWIDNNGVLQQHGGEVTLESPLQLQGGYAPDPRGGQVSTFASYELNGGAFYAPSLVLSNRGSYVQQGGTNTLAAMLSVEGGEYFLTVGTLSTVNAGVSATSSIRQSGGKHEVREVLSVTGQYHRKGGDVHVGGFYLRGLLESSGFGSFTNTGLTDVGGVIEVSSQLNALGRVRVTTNAAVNFSGGPAVVRFESSIAESWAPGAKLTISNWNETLPANNHVYFGDNDSSLSAAQLAQVQFVNPVARPPGVYAAQISFNGQLVPAQQLPGVSGWPQWMRYYPYPFTKRNVVSISARANVNMAATTDGQVVVWPQHDHYPVPPVLRNAVEVAAGISKWYALLADGTVASWGHPEHGWTNVPPGLKNVAAIAAAGASYALALREDGSIVSWGTEQHLWGNSAIPQAAMPAIAIASGNLHNLALRPDSTVVAWGYNAYNQTNVPAGLSNVVAVACGDHFSMALKSDGTLVCWGENEYGQCDVPAGLSNVVSIAGGHGFALALRADGTVKAWGENWYGQTNVPPWATNIVDIAADYNQAVVLFAGGERPRALMTEPKFTQPAGQGAGAFSVKIPSRSGHVLRLEYTHSLAQPAWIALPLMAARPGYTTLTDPGSAAQVRYYRVKQW